jgi:hypothetical protein
MSALRKSFKNRRDAPELDSDGDDKAQNDESPSKIGINESSSDDDFFVQSPRPKRKFTTV